MKKSYVRNNYKYDENSFYLGRRTLIFIEKEKKKITSKFAIFKKII